MLIDPAWFEPEAVPEDVAEFNEWLVAETARRPTAMEAGVEASRAGREAGRSIFGPLHVDPDAYEDVIADGLKVRVLEPAGTPTGVYLHVHGGGWVLGAAAHRDRANRRLAEEARVVVVSVEYRLAPEHPYPGGRDDCLAAARWLVANAERRWGVDSLLIGGESAGAHLAALTLLNMPRGTFAKALLTYGAYDVRDTPSVVHWGERDIVLSQPLMNWFAQLTFGDRPDLGDPSISPLFADLTGLPPVRFMVGSLDPLLDDTLFMAARWVAAGNEAELEVFPGGIHAFDAFAHHPYTERAEAAASRFLSGGRA